jgi:hypothetical protein
MRSTEEIAAEIVGEIRKENVAVDEERIHKIVDMLTLPSIRDSKFGNRKQNKRYAEEVIKWIDDGQRLLDGRQDTFDPSSLFREKPIEPDGPTIVVGWFERERARSLKDILADMRRQAELIIDNEIGAHGNSGQDQKLAAEVAVGFVAGHGLPATYSSENSVYCKVARLCFEAITGRSSENGEDIRRACRVIAQEHPAAGLAKLGLPCLRSLDLPSLTMASAIRHIGESLLKDQRKGLITDSQVLEKLYVLRRILSGRMDVSDILESLIIDAELAFDDIGTEKASED